MRRSGAVLSRGEKQALARWPVLAMIQITTRRRYLNMQSKNARLTQIRSLLILLASPTILSGCVTNTVSELRADSSSYDGTVQVKYEPDQVYRNLREIARNCLEQAPMGTPVVSETEFDAPSQTGQVRQRMTAQNVLLNMSIIEIYRHVPAGTDLKLYAIKGWKSIGVDMPKLEDLTRWSSGDKTCWKKR
jgi:hypothetical protein